jgi:hypothetical protein
MYSNGIKMKKKMAETERAFLTGRVRFISDVVDKAVAGSPGMFS